VFTRRGYRWKLLGAVGLVAGLLAYAGSRGSRVDPPLWRCLAEPERWNGVTLHIPEAEVLSVGAGDFQIQVEQSTIRVHGQAPVAARDRGSLMATFDSQGPGLGLVRWQARARPTGGTPLRAGLELLTAVGILLNFAKHFSLRTRALQVEETP
jgi:hypothetical protein